MLGSFVYLLLIQARFLLMF